MKGDEREAVLLLYSHHVHTPQLRTYITCSPARICLCAYSRDGVSGRTCPHMPIEQNTKRHNVMSMRSVCYTVKLKSSP